MLIMDFSESEQSVVSVRSLESQLARLSLESEVLNNVIDTFKNIVPNLTRRLTEVVSSLSVVKTTETSSIIKAIDKHKALSTKIKFINYAVSKKTLISVPEGFKGDFLNYSVSLNQMMPTLYTNSNALLAEYNFILSSFITNKDDKLSLKDHSNLFKEAKAIREKTMSVNDKYFNVNRDMSKGYLGDALERISDLEPLMAEIKKLDKGHHVQNLEQLRDTVTKTTDLLNIIIKNIQEKGSDRVTGNAAKNIAEGAFEIGKLVESVSIMHYRIDQFLQCIVKLLDTLDNMC